MIFYQFPPILVELTSKSVSTRALSLCFLSTYACHSIKSKPYCVDALLIISNKACVLCMSIWTQYNTWPKVTAQYGY
jgi:hypothetical protein